MAETYSAGVVTAYGAAVRGGYTGTYEQFCAEQASFAASARQVAEDRAAVEQLAETFEDQTVPAAVGQVNQAGAAQVQAVQAAGADEESDISAAGSTQVQAVQAAGSTQVQAVQAAGSTQVQAVQTAGAAQVTAVQGAGTTQVAAVNAAGAAQVDAVEDKGEEVLASIPQDYSALSGEVDDLKSALNFNKTATPGYLFRATNTGNGSEWSPVGLPTDAQTASAVADWLNAHPEATTTVQDHSLSVDKMIVGTLGYVTPEMFGARGDGITDDTSAIKQAISTGKVLIGDLSKTYAISEGLQTDGYIYNLSLKAIESIEYVLKYNKRNTIIANVQIDCNELAEYGIIGITTPPQDSMYVAQITNCAVKNAIYDGFQTKKVRTNYSYCIAQNCGSSGFVIGISDTKHDCLMAIDCQNGVYIGYKVGNTSIGRFQPWSWEKKQTGLYMETESSANIDYYYADSNEIGILFKSAVSITIGTLVCFNNPNAPSAVDSDCRLFKKESDGRNDQAMISVGTLSGSFTGHDDYFLIPDGIDISYINIPYIYIINVPTCFDKKMFRLTSIPSSMFTTLLNKFSVTGTALTLDKVSISKCSSHIDGYNIRFSVEFNTATDAQLDNTVDVVEFQYLGTETIRANYKLENILSSFSAPSFHIVKKGDKGFSIRPNATYSITGKLILTIDVYVTLY